MGPAVALLQPFRASEVALPYLSLQPEDAQALAIRTYILVGTAMLFGWDVIHSFYAEQRLRREHKVSIPCIVYIISRFWTLTAVIYSLIYATTPIRSGTCDAHDTVINIVSTIALGCCTILVLFRVRAAFYNSQLVGIIYGVFWLIHLTLTAVGHFGTPKSPAIPIPGTKFCIPSGSNFYQTTSICFLCVYHTIVFVGVSCRIGTVTEGWANPTRSVLPLAEKRKSAATVRLWIKSTVMGCDLPPFCKSMLRYGQIYYLSTLALSLVCIIMSTVFHDSPFYGTMFNLPNIVIMNILACRVYRNTKLDVPVVQGPTPPMTFAVNPSTSHIFGDIPIRDVSSVHKKSPRTVDFPLSPA